MIVGDFVIVIEEDADLDFLGQVVTLLEFDPDLEHSWYRYYVSHPTFGKTWVKEVALPTPLLKALF
jgi:hypothetical protein